MFDKAPNVKFPQNFLSLGFWRLYCFAVCTVLPFQCNLVRKVWKLTLSFVFQIHWTFKSWIGTVGGVKTETTVNLTEHTSHQKTSIEKLAFKTLNTFLQAIISSPHGSAANERLLSAIGIIKNKYKLSFNNVQYLFFCKSLINNTTYYNWQPYWFNRFSRRKSTNDYFVSMYVPFYLLTFVNSISFKTTILANAGST